MSVTKEIEEARREAGYKTLSTRIAYENPWTAVREDIIVHPGGHEGLFGIVERKEAVVILPLHQDGRVTLIRQFRYPVGERLWELPMGMWETRESVDPLELARGELREETGLRAGEMVYAGALFQGPGYSTQKVHVFLAKNLKPGETEREETEMTMTVHEKSLAEFEAMIVRGEIRCMVTVAAFGLIRAKGLF